MTRSKSMFSERSERVSGGGRLVDGPGPGVGSYSVVHESKRERRRGRKKKERKGKRKGKKKIKGKKRVRG